MDTPASDPAPAADPSSPDLIPLSGVRMVRVYEPGDDKENDRDIAYRALLSAALTTANTAHLDTITYKAALKVAAFAANALDHRPLQGDERPDRLAELAEGLRDIIRVFPDEADAPCAVLRNLNGATNDASSPRFWRPTKQQKALAAQALGCDPGTAMDFAFDHDGAFYARLLTGNFQRVPLDVIPAAESADAE